MKNICLLILLSTSFFSFSQTTYESGILFTKNKKIEALIKNDDWISPPKKIFYKLSENGEVKSISEKNLLGFEIFNSHHKYKKHDVKVNFENGILKQSESLTQNIISKPLLLRVLIEGKATLLQYNNNLLFYKINGENVKQITYSQYINDDDKIIITEEFKKDLYSDLKCDKFNPNRFRNLKYNKKEFIKLFQDYNLCNNYDFKIYSNLKKTKGLFNLSISGGINLQTVSIDLERGVLMETVSLPTKTNFSLGLEIEYIFGFNNNKWSIYSAPNYQYYNGTSKDLSLFGGFQGNIEVNTSFIEIPFGLRHYMFLNQNSQIFINGSIGLISVLNKNDFFKFNNSIQTQIDFLEFTDSKNSSLSFAVGYKYMDKYSFQTSIYADKSIGNDYASANFTGSIKFTVNYIIF